jgi:hypothetical protein
MTAKRKEYWMRVDPGDQRQGDGIQVVVEFERLLLRRDPGV